MINIAVTNLAAYNEGRLIYKWLALPADENTIREAYKSIGCDLDDENAPESFISDYETTDEAAELNLSVGEYENVWELNDLAERIAVLNSYEMAELIAYTEAYGDRREDIEDALDSLDNMTFYEGYTMEDLAEELVEEGAYGDIPESIACYIDYAAIARDLSFDYTETSKGVICCA